MPMFDFQEEPVWLSVMELNHYIYACAKHEQFPSATVLDTNDEIDAGLKKSIEYSAQQGNAFMQRYFYTAAPNAVYWPKPLLMGDTLFPTRQEKMVTPLGQYQDKVAVGALYTGGSLETNEPPGLFSGHDLEWGFIEQRMRQRQGKSNFFLLFLWSRYDQMLYLIALREKACFSDWIGLQKRLTIREHIGLASYSSYDFYGAPLYISRNKDGICGIRWGGQLTLLSAPAYPPI